MLLPSIILVLKMFVCLHICCQAVVHAKRKKREEEKSPSEDGIYSEKCLDRDSLKSKLFLMNKMLRNEELDNSVLYLFACSN